MTRLASVVLFSDHPVETIAFYRALGVPLEDEDHGDGVLHAAADVDGIHMAVLPAARSTTPGWRGSGSTFVGLWVPDLDGATAAAERLGAPLLLGHQRAEWGCRVVVTDPDGRALELNQEDHCPPQAS